MEYDTLYHVPDPGVEYPGRAVRLAVLDNRRDNTFQIGKGFNRYV
jgi:hypothetical protein